MYIGRVKLFPKREFIIETELSVDEVKEKLLQLFNKKRGRDYYNLLKTKRLENKYYYGFIEGEKFALYYDDFFVMLKSESLHDSAKNNEFMCRGTFKEKGDKTIVFITVDTARRSSLYRFFSLLFTVAVLLLFFKFKNQISSVINVIYFSLLISIIGFCLRFYFRNQYFNKVKLFLNTFFEAE